jgi:hypothetical protein
MFYPGSGSLNFSSRIWITDPGGKKAPDPGSQILLYIKRGMRKKPTFFLLLMVSETIFISKKIKEQGF